MKVHLYHTPKSYSSDEVAIAVISKTREWADEAARKILGPDRFERYLRQEHAFQEGGVIIAGGYYGPNLDYQGPHGLKPWDD